MKQSSVATGLRQILRVARIQYDNVALAVSLSFVAVLATLALPLGIRALIDSATHRLSHLSLTLLAACLVALFTLRGIAGFFASYLLRITGERVVSDLRIRLFGHVNKLSVSHLIDRNAGELLSRLTNDVAAVRTATTDALASVVAQSTSLLGSAVVMFAMNWQLAMFLFVVMPLAAFISRRFGNRLHSLSTMVQDQLARASTIAEEVFAAFAVVKSFNREDHETRRYAEATEGVFNNARRAAFTASLSSTVVEFLFTGATVAIFWYGGTEMQHSRLTAGALVAFLFYAQNIAQSVSNLTQTYGNLRSATGAAVRLSDILSTPTEISQKRGSLIDRPISGSLEFRGVGFRAGGREILRDISLAIGNGERVLLVGPNGAGKSTLLKLVLRFHEPTAGQILLGGTDIAKIDPYDLRDNIGYVPQEVQLFDTSIMENIRYGKIDASEAEIIEAAEAANVDECVTLLPRGYHTIVGVRGARLSGGERQRISLARALLRKPAILLLDEPTSAVDPVSDRLIQDAIINIMRNHTVVTIAHRLSNVAGFDRIVVVSGGSIIQVGTAADLIGIADAHQEVTKLPRNLRVPHDAPGGQVGLHDSLDDQSEGSEDLSVV